MGCRAGCGGGCQVRWLGADEKTQEPSASDSGPTARSRAPLPHESRPPPALPQAAADRVGATRVLDTHPSLGCWTQTSERPQPDTHTQHNTARPASASPAPPPPPTARRTRLPPSSRPSATPAAAAQPPPVPPASVAVILLAGGSGKRMGAPTPKQYLPLAGRPMALHSLAAFAGMAEVAQIVVVCDPAYRPLFADALAALPGPTPPLAWALPGAERQDSVCAGLAAADPAASLVAVHDSARPVVSPADVRRCLADGAAVGAAVLGVPVKPTIKEVNDDGTVARTLERARLWEVQTPQVIRPALLRAGFEAAAAGGWAVTDDVSLIEGLGLPVRVTPGSYTNIKVR